ncbi:MAG TPA: AAA family ATPase [Marmoricola sp.]|nr:AAA family ATPase [Marmoricola sp.]
MSRLIHLNGPPGIGKSTLARRYADEHPGVLDCDVDVLRTLVGGWQADFNAAGGLIRPAALAMITAYLGEGHDVVLPQMLRDPGEVARFEGAASVVGASFVEVMLMDTLARSVSRFHRRGSGSSEPWHGEVRAIVEGLGGDEHLAATHIGLQDLLDLRPDIVVIPSVEGQVDATYDALLAALGGVC